MAVNTKEVAKGLAGLPTQEEMLAPENFDTVDASVGGQEGAAKLTEGEIVFSIPAIIAAGEGDYESGAKMIMEIHEMLREKSKGFIDDKGLAAAGLNE